MNINPRIIIMVLGLSLTACGTSNTLQTGNLSTHPTTQATLWVQNAAEYSALTTQAYFTAMRNLQLPLEDSFWTASVEQGDKSEITSLPPAIILDIDETVLDNSPFQARMIKQGKSYNTNDWNAWCNEANADAVPGALEFTRYAAEQGVEIFYISNRDYAVEEATRANLKALGFPVADTADQILTKGEQPEWDSSKIKRRAVIEQNYRVVMIFGDDLNDFIPAKNISQSERKQIIDEYSEFFGKKWFMLPNPVYGSWDQALYNFDRDLSEEERIEIQRNSLNTKN